MLGKASQVELPIKWKDALEGSLRAKPAFVSSHAVGLG
jgi:hypothetical protein